MNIKALWNKQIVPTPDRFDLSHKIKVFRRNGVRRLLILNAILLLTICFVVFIWIYFKPQSIYTEIGILLTIPPISIVILQNWRMLPVYREINESCTNSDYIAGLLAVKSKERLMQTKILNLYFILLSVGIGMYMYEYTFERSILLGIVAYLLFLLWVGINWFVWRPRIIRRNRQNIDSLIEQAERIQRQFRDS